MLFGIVITALVACLAIVFLKALWRRRDVGMAAAEYDMQVYRDQLEELDRDLARGTITQDDLAAAKIDVSRKLLEADRRATAAQTTPQAPRAANWVASALIAAGLAGAVALYWDLGNHGYADQPIRARLSDAKDRYRNRPDQSAAEASFAQTITPPDIDPQYKALMDKLRAAVAANPDDQTGLALLAKNEMSLGNLAAGRAAQSRLVAAKGDQATPDDTARLGEYMVAAAGGLVTPEAEAEFAKTLEDDPQNGRARYYIGLMMAQNSRPDRAFQMWEALLRTSQPTDDWVAPLRETLPAVAWLAGYPDYVLPTLSPVGPSAQDLVAARAMPDDQRMARLGPPLDALRAQLARQGGGVEDWARLIAGLVLVGRDPLATDILSEAQEVFADAPESLALLRGAADGTWPPETLPETPPENTAQRGPSADDIAAAQNLSATDRQAMIEGMVNGLTERLQTQGGSAAEWVRAINALATMGQMERAAEIYTQGKAALTQAQDEDGLRALTAAADGIGLTR
ncbi:c-type cytochrome biogenesis protein CcmI [Rhodobacteraceae bacterium]|nr:c-type cytochrome biogenesis protein CcmI [Paracoccaceae bacterium]